MKIRVPRLEYFPPVLGNVIEDENGVGRDYEVLEPAICPEGSWVRVVQIIVGATPDGLYGAGTEALVRNFQSAMGLATDGIVGPLTANAIVNGKDQP